MANINAQFLVKNAAGTGYDKYNWETLSAQVRRTEGGQTIEAAISALESTVGGASQFIFVDDITERDGLTGLVKGDRVFVIDATDDSTVDDGWAVYIWDGAVFIKLAEEESMDVSLVWSAISGRPSSAVADIDAAVTLRHAHESAPTVSNLATLNKITEAAGVPKFDGEDIFLGDIYTIGTTEPDGTTIPRTPFWFKTV